jgi:hypothetical protein
VNQLGDKKEPEESKKTAQGFKQNLSKTEGEKGPFPVLQTPNFFFHLP